MNHYATPDFWLCYKSLPSDVQQLADKSYKLLQSNSRHPSLHFKKVGDFWSARVSLNYRALAVEADDGYVWFWLGTHKEYDRLIS